MGAERCLWDLRPREIVHETYSYPSTPSGEAGVEGGLSGASLFAVAPDTPRGDLQLWNLRKLVGLCELNAKEMCLVKCSPKVGDVDFLACINWRPAFGKSKDRRDRVCTKMSHVDVPGKGDRVSWITLLGE